MLVDMTKFNGVPLTSISVSPVPTHVDFANAPLMIMINAQTKQRMTAHKLSSADVERLINEYLDTQETA